jgi:heterodisulfide reductase subunit C
MKQIAFILFLILALGVFAYTCKRLYSFFKITRKGFVVDRIGERIKITLLVAFGQTKILRKPVIGLLHALVWWGFIVITIGTGEMVLDGILGTERVLGPLLGPIYDIIVASGDVFAAIILVSCLIFLFRRHVIKVKRFSGVEMTPKSSIDATIALTMIFFLMVSLIGMNMGYLAVAEGNLYGSYPISSSLLNFISGLTTEQQHLFFEVSWWTHICLVFIFLNVLPYSKHFHVIMSVPNVFLTDMKPYTKIHNMPSVTKEVQLMLNPDMAASVTAESTTAPTRFGIKDIEDVTWKNYVDSLTCTECGRCTSVCPANTTGKLLSPRKILVDVRKRMNHKGPGLAKDKNYSDGKSLAGDYITAEELWACTTCNACVQECPVDIDHVSIIMDMRRYLVMEESSMPAPIATMISNIENNGAPWQYSPN